MKCHDVRRALTLFVDGQLALTEWAIIQGHLLQCAGCRKEFERLHALAAVRARATQRRATVTTAVGMAVVLSVAVVGGVLVYHGTFPDLPSWGTPLPPQTAIPSELGPEPIAPAPVPSPFVRSSPPPARGKGTAEATPWGTVPPASEPPARAMRPPATAEAPAEDRMPTSQARPAAALTAPPGAEAMPTQAPPRGSR